MTKLAQNSTYTLDQTNLLLSLYETLGPNSLEDIAKKLNKPTKSVVAKLAACGVYKKPEKVINKKRTGPSKKELLRDLEKILEFDTTGFFSVKKEDLQKLLNYVEALKTQSKISAEGAR